MKPKNNSLKATSQDGQMKPAPGYKMAIQPKQGESATKQITVGKASTTTDKNGVYVPKPTTVAKAPVPAPSKSNWKAPTGKQTGMKMQMKVGGKGRKC